MSGTLPSTRDVLFMLGGATLSALLFAGSATLAARATATREAPFEATATGQSSTAPTPSVAFPPTEISGSPDTFVG